MHRHTEELLSAQWSSLPKWIKTRQGISGRQQKKESQDRCLIQAPNPAPNNVCYTNRAIPNHVCETSTQHDSFMSLLIQREQMRLCSHKYESCKDIYTNALLPSFFMFSVSHRRQSQNMLLIPLGGHWFNPWLLNTCPDSSANGQSFTEH